MNKLGIYIHIPFCKQKCFYCDFCSSVALDEEQIEKYIDALCTEILLNAELLQTKCIDTIYIGGGTPSVINEKHIIKILDTLKLFTNNLEEVTIELNPESVTYEKLKAYFNAGINRVSIGLQSANDDTLKKIGRLHTKSDFYNAYQNTIKAGFKNISCDVIIGLPDENYKDFEKTIDYILSLDKITHISAYSLEVHENTKLDFLVQNQFLSLPNEETERDMKYLLDEKLKNAGFIRYEISNYAKPGFEAKHNLKYWHQEEYLGFGVAASSFINSTRYTNIKNINKYIDNIYYSSSNKEEIDELDKLDLIKEYIILNLRLKDGVNLNKFKEKFKKDIFELYEVQINKLIQNKLLVKADNAIYLSDKGEDLANIVWQEFI